MTALVFRRFHHRRLKRALERGHLVARPGAEFGARPCCCAELERALVRVREDRVDRSSSAATAACGAAVLAASIARWILA